MVVIFASNSEEKLLKNFKTAWADLIIDNRVITILLSSIIITIAIFATIKFPLKYDNSFEMFMLKDDPNIVKFENFRELFGDAEYLSVGIQARPGDTDLFVAETIKVIHEISSMLEDNLFVSKVSGLSNYQYMHNLNGIMVTDDLFADPGSLEDGSPELLTAREIMRTEGLAHDRIITKDLQHARILVRTEYIRNENDHKVKISNDIYQFLADNDYLSQGYQIRLSGGAIISERFETLSKRDTSLLNPLVAIIMCVILYFLYGTFISCLLPWFLIGTSVTLVSGLQALLNFPMTVVNAALIPTMMILGMGVSVHTLSEFFVLRKNGYEPKIAAKRTIENLFKPIFFTALTTSIGFSALAVTELVPVKQYALLAAFGSLLVFLVAMTLFASVLSFVSLLPDNKLQSKSNALIDQVTRKLAHFTSVNRKRITIFVMGFIIFCILTLPKISVDSNIFNYFKSSNWLTQDMEYFDDLYKFGGLELDIDSGQVDGIKEPEFLRSVEVLESRLNDYSKIGKVSSIIEFLKKLRQSLNFDNDEFFILPDSPEMTAQLLLMYENSGPDDDLSDIIDFDNRYLRVTVPIVNLSAKQFSNFYKLIQADLSKTHPSLKIEYTGPMVLYNAQEIYINSGLKQSFSLALAMIGLSFFILFKSVKYGFIALFPSVLPILIVGGSTVFMGLSLDLGTIIVGAMCMGIAVDDAIHVMARYIDCKAKGDTVRESIDFALKTSGKAVIFTSLILVSSFSVMLFASLIPTILFGVFVALIMALALLGDLLVLPALLFLFDRD